MPHYTTRLLDLRSLAESKSHFLFGPRQTGKSTLLREQFTDIPSYNLLDNTVYNELIRNPRLIREEIQARNRNIVVIDEIQRLPELLNEVHLMIEELGIRFVMSGSSARSLRKKGVNLLGGRARTRRMHPFVSSELAAQFDLERALEFGLLPSIYFSDSPGEDLKAYVSNYLSEEIAAGGLTRNLGAFARFLDVVGLSHGQMINFERIANESQVPAATVRGYFQILKDSFLIHEVRSFTETRIRKAITTSKFFLFDIGVARQIQGRRGLAQRTPEFGQAFESFIHQELVVYCDSCSLDLPAYWRSKSNFEVDFVVDDTAIEVKASANVNTHDFRGLRALREEGLLSRYLLIAMVERPRVVDNDFLVLPWRKFLDILWSGHLRDLPNTDVLETC